MLTPVEWIVFLAIGSAAFAGAMVAKRFSLAASNSPGDQLDWLPELEIATLESPKVRNENHDKVDLWLHRIVDQSGSGLNHGSFLLINFLVAFIAGWIPLEFELTITVAVLSGLTSFAFGLITVYVLFSKRRKKFNEQFPVAVDLIACSVEAGQSLEEAISTSSESVEDPAKSELLRCVRQIDLGITPASCIVKMARRIPTIDVKIFAHTIAVHEEMGGQLGKTLRRMAGVIRQRGDDLQKARSATSLGRFAAVMICSIGVLALLYLVAFQQEYIAKLTESPLGQKMAIYAAVSELVGIGCILLVMQDEG